MIVLSNPLLYFLLSLLFNWAFSEACCCWGLSLPIGVFKRRRERRAPTTQICIEQSFISMDNLSGKKAKNFLHERSTVTVVNVELCHQWRIVYQAATKHGGNYGTRWHDSQLFFLHRLRSCPIFVIRFTSYIFLRFSYSVVQSPDLGFQSTRLVLNLVY